MKYIIDKKEIKENKEVKEEDNIENIANAANISNMEELQYLEGFKEYLKSSFIYDDDLTTCIAANLEAYFGENPFMNKIIDAAICEIMACDDI